MISRLFTLLLAASCLTAVGQSEYCLDGTVWDAALGGCIPDVAQCHLQYDFNGTGSVGAEDLLMFLTGFAATIADVDSDGVCDEVDDCMGEYDECGICGGPGAVEPVFDSITILYDSVYAEQIDAWVLFEVGVDTVYSYQCFSSCGDPFIYQGYLYTTVSIGEQCWFAENLRSENYENGDPIPAGLNRLDWISTNVGAVAVYGEQNDDYCNDWSPDGDACNELWSLNEYGRLYNWYSVNDSRGLCPSGWHVPTDGEWEELPYQLGAFGYGAQYSSADSLRSDYGWYGGGNGTNSSGFLALPGGRRRVDAESFEHAGFRGYWWSSTPTGNGALGRMLVTGADYISPLTEWDTVRNNGYSVRCIKDSE